jgi:O-antigen/teichoic acid export membrane protein
MSLLGSVVHFVPSYLVAIAGYFGLNVFAARLLGTGNFGYFAVVLTVTTLTGQQGLLGVHRAGLREASISEDPETLTQLRGGVRAVLLVPLPIASVLTGLGAWLWRAEDSAGVAVGAFAAALTYCSGYGMVSASFLRGLGRIRSANLLSGRSGGAVVAVAQTAGVGLVWVLDPRSGLAGVLAGTTVGYVVPLLWAAWLLQRSWGHSQAPVGIWLHLRHVLRRDWRFAAGQAASYLNSAVELWIAGGLLSAQATSVFAAAQRVGRLLLIPTTALQVVFSPAMARLARRDDRSDLEPLVRTGATIATVLAAVVWVPLMVAPGLVLRVVFGADFSSAAAVAALMLLASRYFLNSVSGPSTPLLSMAHREGDVAVMNWLVLGARVCSGFVCAYLWGTVGLALSAFVWAGIGYAASWWVARWRLSVRTDLTLRPSLSLLNKVSG